jgi:hypothetical protein
MADIDVAAARTAPIPFIESENNPRTRTLNEDEQADLVEVSNFGVVMIQDMLDEGHYDDGKEEVLESLRDRVNTLLTVTKKAE